MTASTQTQTQHEQGQEHDQHRDVPRRRHAPIGRIVSGSLAAGLAAAAALVLAPFTTADEPVLTGVVLLGFAFGWTLLAVLSTWLSHQPQRWAAAPAVFMGLSGWVLLVGSDTLLDVLGWVWPPALLVLVVWMFMQARRQLHSRTRAWLLHPVLVVLAIASLGAGYTTVRASVDAHAHPMRGQLVDVGTHDLHLECTGPSTGPTVVLEPGAGEMSSILGWITPVVARDTRVCVYDRAGRGWSDAATRTQDGARIATDLHTLLHRGHVPGPYVLAGHSFGGLYVATFAARHPDEVAGMVLVDSAAPAVDATPPAPGSSYDAMGRLSAMVSASARLGLGRLYGHLSYGSLPPRSQDEARASAATASHAGSTVDEYAAAASSMHQARSLEDFAAKPLVVLTAGRGHDGQWMAAQNRMATLSSNSLHTVVAGASHASLIDHERDAAAVTRAIREVVTSVRTSKPLR